MGRASRLPTRQSFRAYTARGNRQLRELSIIAIGCGSIPGAILEIIRSIDSFHENAESRDRAAHQLLQMLQSESKQRGMRMVINYEYNIKIPLRFSNSISITSR